MPWPLAQLYPRSTLYPSGPLAPAWQRFDDAFKAGLERANNAFRAFALISAPPPGFDGHFVYGPAARTFDYEAALTAAGSILSGDYDVAANCLLDFWLLQEIALPPAA